LASDKLEKDFEGSGHILINFPSGNSPGWTNINKGMPTPE